MNKTALVTGASEGLGRAFVGQLAAQGYNTLCVARNEARLKQLTERLATDFPGEHQYLVADLATTTGLQACRAILEKQRVHLLVNNAGLSQFGAFRDASIESEQQILSVNAETVLALSHSFLQQAKRGDSLINLSSITNSFTTPIQPTYCATKCFIASLSESLWYQERKHGVYVQALLPGITKSQFIDRSSRIEGFKKELLNFISGTPESVVKHSLKAMNKRQGPIVVPGISNKLLVIFLRLLPRKWVIICLGKIGDLAD